MHDIIKLKYDKGGREMKRSEIEQLKQIYREELRIRLLKMDDSQAPPIGTQGTVSGVDDIGSVMVEWDTGSRLKVLLDQDEIELIN